MRTPPLERPCAEMLCGVLLNAPTLCSRLMQWLAARAEIEALPNFAPEQLRIATEQPIESKRDDLRLTALHPETNERLLLWTFEIKIGGGFHYSPPIPALAANTDYVLQIENYDAWLDGQEDVRDTRAGFILTTDPALTLSAELRCKWTCLTWTDLGLEVEQTLAALPPREAVLAEHFAGFIRAHLWTDPMTQDPLQFDDLALLRALASYGAQTKERVDNMVAQLIPRLRASGLNVGQIKHSRQLYGGPHPRSLIYASTNPDADGDLPWIMAGVINSGTPKLAVWLETEPRHVNKERGCDVVRERLGALRERNSAWDAPAAHEGEWQDLRLVMPLEPILGASSQVAYFNSFFDRAFADLQQTEVAAALAEVYR